MNITPRIFQINASNGGVPKTAVASAEVNELGLTADRQRNQKVHGGVERAICLYPIETILALQAKGHPIFPGSTGENITTIGIPADALQPGIRLRLGSAVLLELTSYVVPCATITGSFLDRDSGRVSQDTHPGFARVYARVLRGGRISAGDRIELLT